MKIYLGIAFDLLDDFYYAISIFVPIAKPTKSCELNTSPLKDKQNWNCETIYNFCETKTNKMGKFLLHGFHKPFGW